MPKIKDLNGRQYVVTDEQKAEHDLVKKAWKAKEKAAQAKAEFEALKKKIIELARDRGESIAQTVRIGGPAYPQARIEFPKTVTVDSVIVDALPKKMREKCFDAKRKYSRKKDFEQLVNELRLEDQGRVKKALVTKSKSPSMSFELDSGEAKSKKKGRKAS